jgi:amidase
MARTVDDVAWLLSIMAGADPRDPGSLPSNPASFAESLERSFAGTRVAWCPDLGGLPLDPAVRAVLDRHRQTFIDLGCEVDAVAPDLEGADEVFLTIRAFRTAATLGPLLRSHRDQLKPEAIWEIERGLSLTGADIAAAMIRHGELLERMRRFEERYAFVLCAVNQVPPFDAALRWPQTIDGVAMDTYIAWMKSAYWISATFRPAASVPAGFTGDGLPVGLQVVGRYRDDRSVLELAQAFEQATGAGRRRPPIA